jgi:hypothetical protein
MDTSPQIVTYGQVISRSDLTGSEFRCLLDLLWQDRHRKQQYFLVRKQEPHFGPGVQHLDLEMVHSHWPAKYDPKSGEISLPDNLK